MVTHVNSTCSYIGAVCEKHLDRVRFGNQEKSSVDGSEVLLTTCDVKTSVYVVGSTSTGARQIFEPPAYNFSFILSPWPFVGPL